MLMSETVAMYAERQKTCDHVDQLRRITISSPPPIGIGEFVQCAHCLSRVDESPERYASRSEINDMARAVIASMSAPRTSS